MNCVICDDNDEQTNQLRKFVQVYALEKQLPIKCIVYQKSTDLLDDIKNGHTASLYLLDIVMPEIDGINLAKEIRKFNSYPECVLMFLTSSEEYTFQAFEVDALQYINKPITFDRLHKALDLALQFLHIEPYNFIPINTKSGIHVIAINEIIFIESNRHTLTIYLTTGEQLETKDSAHTITELSNILPCPTFMIPYKGYIINLNFVSHIEKYYFVTINGSKIPIPSRHYNAIKDMFSEYLLRQMRNLMK